MEGLFGKLRKLDAYPKISEDFYSRTLSGGIITIASSIVMFLLFISELRLYIRPVTETKLLVDTSRGERLRINFDITFPALPCSIVSLDAMDISGEEHLDVKHDIIKRRLDAHGHVIEVKQDGIGAPKIEKPLQRHGGRLQHNETYCGSCYGAEVGDDECCNSCEEVREAYRKKGWGMSNPDLIDQCKREGFLQRIKDEDGEGCNIYGFLDVNRVAGNFHFAPGKSFQQSNVHVHDLQAFQKDSFNISHRISKIAFGDFFPGVVNPLDSVQWIQRAPFGMYQYFIKVVPSVYSDINGKKIQSNQFSVTEHFRTDEVGRVQALPGVFFFYDLSPIKVTLTEGHVPFLHFLTNVCAIVGGIFTVSGIVDAFVYHGQRAIKKKMEIECVAPLIHSTPPLQACLPNGELNPQDQLILSWIISSLVADTFAHIVGCESVTTMYYASSSLARLQQLKLQLRNLKKGTHSMQEFTLNTRSIAHQLSIAGSPISDQQLVLSILTGLSSDYSSIAAAVTLR